MSRVRAPSRCCMPLARRPRRTTPTAGGRASRPPGQADPRLRARFSRTSAGTTWIVCRGRAAPVSVCPLRGRRIHSAQCRALRHPRRTAASLPARRSPDVQKIRREPGQLTLYLGYGIRVRSVVLRDYEEQRIEPVLLYPHGRTVAAPRGSVGRPSISRCSSRCPPPTAGT